MVEQELQGPRLEQAEANLGRERDARHEDRFPLLPERRPHVRRESSPGRRRECACHVNTGA